MQTQHQTHELHVEPRSLKRYVAWVVAAGISLFMVGIVTGVPLEIFILINVYAVLLGGALFTAHRQGPGGVRRLFSGIFRWRIGWASWALVVGALPAATIAVAVLTGTYTPPADGWLLVLGDYLFRTFIFGALIVNIFEETAWQGLVQRNLTRRFGLLKAAGLTAVAFAAFHVPMSFANGASTAEALAVTAVVVAMAPAMRYLMGRTDHTTGGSLLAVGVLHASVNASGQLSVVDGDWQYAVGLGVVTVAVLAVDAVRARSNTAVMYADAAAP
jgi:uncharacterized protein